MVVVGFSQDDLSPSTLPLDVTGEAAIECYPQRIAHGLMPAITGETESAIPGHTRGNETIIAEYAGGGKGVVSLSGY